MELTSELPEEGNTQEIKEFLIKHWGSTEIVSRGKVTDAIKIPRITARNSDGKLIGLLTYSIDKTSNSCEMISIDSEIKCKGIGTKLIKMLEDEVKQEGCKRIWFITTNDNLEALNFYIKNDYRFIAIHLNALNLSRKLKPQIPKVGKNGILLQDEWEFEKIRS